MREAVRFFLWIAFCASAVVLAVRAAYGPFGVLGLSVANPINAESFVAVSMWLLVILAGVEAAPDWKGAALRDVWALPALTICGIAAWWWSLRFAFIADDYWHISNTLHATPEYFVKLFTDPAVDHFFRPFGFIAYAAEARAWGVSRIGWHSASVVLHIVNSGLVYALARARRHAAMPALAGALLFVLSGSRPEAVSWVAAQFDVWAAFFFLVALLALHRFVATGREIWEAASLAALFFALLSKESAYVFPLVALVLLAVDCVLWKRAARLLAPSVAVTAAVFVYRWRLLGGIGGYQVPDTGLPFFYSVSLFRTAKGLLLRLPAILNFPLNWTTKPEWWVAVALIAALIAMALLARARPNRRELWFAVGFLYAAAVPVHQFLLIDANLEKSRVLYLPLVGFCLMVVTVLESMPARLAPIAAAGILAFQTAALEHNLAIWKRVSDLVEHTCDAAARQVRETSQHTSQPVLVENLPNYVDGIYFLRTGLRQCIEWSYGGDPANLYVTGESDPPKPKSIRHLVWDERTRALIWLQ